jgi:Domain of unknown function (DUF4412)
MNARSYLVAAVVTAVAGAPLAARAQSGFEGVVTFQMTAGAAGPQTMSYSVKGHKVRMDISAGSMQMFNLMDADTKTVDMVIPMRQMYMEQTMPDLSAMVDSAAAKAKITWTGNKETIAGYECEHATITDDSGQTMDVCLTKDLGPFLSMRGGPGGRGGRGMAMGGDWEDHIGQMFPLKVSRGGEVQLVVTNVEKKSLDDSIFTIPQGYQKMSMPMGGRMGGRRGGGG